MPTDTHTQIYVEYVYTYIYMFIYMCVYIYICIYICIYLHIYVFICIHSYLSRLDHFSTVRVPPKLLGPFQKRAQACRILLQTKIDTSGGFWIIATRLFDGNGQERIRKRGRRVHMREHGTCVCVYVCVCVCVCAYVRVCVSL